MAKLDLKEIKKKFNKLKGLKQWEMLLEIKEHGRLFLDNDSTTFYFKQELDPDCDYSLDLDDWLGNGPGIEHILDLLKFEYEFA